MPEEQLVRGGRAFGNGWGVISQNRLKEDNVVDKLSAKYPELGFSGSRNELLPRFGWRWQKRFADGDLGENLYQRVTRSRHATRVAA
eukprot:3342696-Rhodomonas_salina.3